MFAGQRLEFMRAAPKAQQALPRCETMDAAKDPLGRKDAGIVQGNAPEVSAADAATRSAADHSCRRFGHGCELALLYWRRMSSRAIVPRTRFQRGNSLSPNTAPNVVGNAAAVGDVDTPWSCHATPLLRADSHAKVLPDPAGPNIWDAVSKCALAIAIEQRDPLVAWRGEFQGILKPVTS
jgi:hypothetical protein